MKKLLLALLVLFTTALAAPPPTSVVGRWVAGSASATTYWDNSGKYVGNGNGSGQLYVFRPDGSFEYYMVMEVRTYGMLSLVRTNYSGKADFSGGTFRLSPTAGHYHSEMGSKVTDRAMSAEELAKASKSYGFRLEQGADGRPHLIIPFEDGSSHDFTPAPKA